MRWLAVAIIVMLGVLANAPPAAAMGEPEIRDVYLNAAGCNSTQRETTFFASESYIYCVVSVYVYRYAPLSLYDMTVDWHSPDGSRYQRDAFTFERPSVSGLLTFCARLAVRGTAAASLSGGWQVRVTIDFGDRKVVTFTLKPPANTAPVARFTWSPASPRAGETVTFDASASSDPDGTIASYRWNFGDGTSGTGVNPKKVYSAAGTYTVILTVTDNLGATNSISQSVTVTPPNQPPVASFAWTPEKPNPNEQVTVDASASYDPDGVIRSYIWDFNGDGVADLTTASPIATHRFSSCGTARVTLRVVDDQGAAGLVTRSIPVNCPPIAQFTRLPTVPQPGQPVQFDGSSSSDPDGQVVSYSWDFGDGSPVEFGVRVSHAYSAPGTYTVVLTVSDDRGLTGVSRQAVRVNAPPVAAFEWSPSVPSVGEPVTFNAVRDRSLSYDPDGTLVSYAWDFGDNTPAVTIRPPQTQVAHAFTRSGIYRVTLTVTDSDGASMSYSKDVRVNQPPVASFIWSPEKVNSGEEITFDASGSYDPDGQILSYSWDFGDGRTSTGMQVSQRYTTGGDYTVRLVVRDNDGAMGTLTRTVHVNLPPSARFSWLSRVPQIGEVVQFDGSSSSDPDGQVVSYSWDFGDGSPVEFGVRVSHAYSAPGTYTVVLTVSDDRGLTGVSRQAVRVNAPPVAAFEWSPTIPSAGVSVTFTAVRDRTLSYDPDGTIVSYTWDFGDRTPPVTIKAPATSVAHAYAQCGSYTVTLTVTDSDGAMATASRDLGVNCSPVAAFDWSPKEPDRGEAVTFDASSSYDRDGTIASYTWDFGDGTPSVTIRDPQVTHEFSRYGTYTVRLTVRDDHGAPGIVSAIVKIVDRIPPTSVASVPSLVCPHGWYDRPVTIMLIASDNDAVATIQYRVNSGSIRSVSGTSAGVLIERDGIYTVEYWATDRSGNEESPHNTIVVSVDQVPPTITIRVPSAGAAFYLNQPVTPEVTVADALSGVAEEVVDPAIDTSSVGRRTFTAKATDRACLTSSVTRTYFVRYKTLLVSPAEQEFGWAAPPPPEGLRGQPIPVSFRVTLGAPLPVALVFLDFYATRVRPGVLPALQVISVRGSGAGETYTPVAGLGGTLIYNDVTSRYEITIPTYTLARGIYELWISADDGGIHRIRFQVV